jgi:hypothetical protein
MPLYPLLIEDAVDQVRDLMRDQLNLNLERVYQQNLDKTINLDLIPDSRYYVSEAIEPLQPPAVFVVADSSDHDLNWQNVAMQTHSVMVGVLVEDQEIQRLTRKCWRYAQAAWLTLHDQAAGNVKVLVRSVDYSPIFVSGAGTERMFRKDATLRCDVLHAETF